ncbi:MAG: hypothetical protein NC033_05560 [Clostridiales bacterium]|nr:hypothetical protein [Clostridiales bacterium]
MKLKIRNKSAAEIVLTVLAIAVLTVAVLLSGIRLGEKIAFAPFYARARSEFIIPTGSGFVGQGLDYLEDEDAFITCGYAATNGNSSMVYYIDADGEASRTVLKNADGSNYTGHTGGIAHYKEYVYITGDDGCDVFALSDFTEHRRVSKKLGEVKTLLDPAYCNVHEGRFYTGSFYRAGNYETPDWQRMTTPNGDYNKSVITVFDIDDNAADTFYISPDPVAAYSTPSLVQGLTFTDDKIVLSTSYGLAASHLKFYDNSGISAGQLNLKGKDVPLYYLDGACLDRTVTVPPMSEEIVYLNGRIYIMTESASNKYIFGKFMSGRHLFSWAY